MDRCPAPWRLSPSQRGGYVLDLCAAPWRDALCLHVHPHPSAPGLWLLTCLGAGLDYYELQAQSGPAACQEALALLIGQHERRLAALRQIASAWPDKGVLWQVH